jgi:hypothetical protein
VRLAQPPAGLLVVVQCLRQQYRPIVTPAAAQARHAACAAWAPDPGATGTVRTSVPIVFLTGTLDARDPRANAAAAAPCPARCWSPCPRSRKHALIHHSR